MNELDIFNKNKQKIITKKDLKLKELVNENKKMKNEMRVIVKKNRELINELAKIKNKETKIIEHLNGKLFYMINMLRLPSLFHFKRKLYIQKSDFDCGTNKIIHAGIEGIRVGLTMHEMYYLDSYNNPIELIDYNWIKFDNYTIEIIIETESGFMDIKNKVKLQLSTKEIK